MHSMDPQLNTAQLQARVKDIVEELRRDGNNEQGQYDFSCDDAGRILGNTPYRGRQMHFPAKIRFDSENNPIDIELKLEELDPELSPEVLLGFRLAFPNIPVWNSAGERDYKLNENDRVFLKNRYFSYALAEVNSGFQIEAGDNLFMVSVNDQKFSIGHVSNSPKFEEIVLTPGIPVMIGRGIYNLGDRFSRQHFSIELTSKGDYLLIRDLGSKNGTMVPSN